MRAVQVLAVADPVVAELEPWSRMASMPRGRTRKGGSDTPLTFFVDPLSSAGLVLRPGKETPENAVRHHGTCIARACMPSLSDPPGPAVPVQEP
jgi:hypothetical protein